MVGWVRGADFVHICRRFPIAIDGGGRMFGVYFRFVLLKEGVWDCCIFCFNPRTKSEGVKGVGEGWWRRGAGSEFMPNDTTDMTKITESFVPEFQQDVFVVWAGKSDMILERFCQSNFDSDSEGFSPSMNFSR
ncbi:UNVERIFIED_CONTAM: hypothetical protein Sangu_1867700 [Sesamum angustifolium]|uniref:Uncharacterized protein n=1 Tax=Sesamum angustifolium TaxID=2727405 RepID=A0AAW2LTN7_9LAMI